MLNKEERTKYYLAHKKDLQIMENTIADNFYNILKSMDDTSNSLYLYEYKEALRKGKQAKLKVKKTKDVKPLKVDRKYIEKSARIDQTNCIREIKGIKLNKYLNRIKNKDVEYELFLFIKDNKVIKTKSVTDNNRGLIKTQNYYKQIGELANKLKVKEIYRVHNHPLVVTALPSRLDIRNHLFAKVDYKVDYGVTLLDSGVVTFDDYYSTEQKLNEANKIIKLARKKGIEDDIELEIIKQMHVYVETNVNRYKKRHLTVHFENDELREKLKKTSNEKYKMIRKKAKEDYLKLLKEFKKQ